MSKVAVLNPFTINPEEHSLAHGIAFDDPSLTVQADAEQADINNIVKRFGVTGMLPYGSLQPIYDDLTAYPTDYHTALNLIKSADNAFMDMPANIRSRFDNDAGQFLAAIEDPNQHDVLRDLGLIPPSVESPDLSGSESPTKQPKGASSSPEGDGTVST